ncbi:MAG: hypothetical protein K2X82_26080 [Gemmataceae bacterium]|nr:hypothetical protein [Gemmataceae bacterium]
MPLRFRVEPSESAKEQLVAAVRDAKKDGRGTEAIAVARAIERGLIWYADELGESRGAAGLIGQVRWVGILPLTAWFAVDLGRRIVYVNRFRYAPRRPRP